MKTDFTIQPVSIHAPIDILGHRFNGLAEIWEAVCVFMRGSQEPFKASAELFQPVEGVHILCNYEPYPTFDDCDSSCENRDYENYYFFDRPITDTETDAIAAIRPRMNFCKVYEGVEMPFDAVVIYYQGDGDNMLVAFPGNSNDAMKTESPFARLVHRLIRK